MSVNRPTRGDIWEIDFGDPIGHEQGFIRPALIVSSDQFHESGFGLYIVLPTTTKRKDYATHVFIPRGEADLREDGYIKCEDVRSVSRDRLIMYHGTVSSETLEAVSDIIFDMFDL